MPVNINSNEIYLFRNLVVDNNDDIFVNNIVGNAGVEQITDGIVTYYKVHNKPLLSQASIAVDKNNVKWVAVAQGLVKIKG